MNEASDEQELLARHAPVLHMDEREYFLPAPVDPFVAASSLWNADGEVQASVELADLDHRWPPGTYLRFVSDDDRRSALASEARRAARNLLSPRLGRVGLFGRVLDALFRLSILLRPTTPRRTSAAAAIKAEAFPPAKPVCYGRVVEQGEWLVLHYAYFYVMNDWRTGYRGVNDHESDWEQAWVFCDPNYLTPVWVAASSHDHHGGDLRRHWSDPELMKSGERPVLFPGAGSHALYFQPGDYVTRIDVPSLRWLLRLQRWAQRWLAIRDEATERGLGPALGAPFVDAASGDGTKIDDWDLRPMGENQPWLGSYRGLWGLDTHDRAGGERGPSGPKFDREGDIRLSWADPLGFAGLHGTPPPSASESRLNLDKIDLAVGDLEEQIRVRGRLLPLAQHSGDEMAEESERLSNLLRQKAELLDLRNRVENEQIAPLDHKAHLRLPAVPLPPPAASGWLLAGWAALSVPLLLLAVAAVLLVDRVQVVVALLIAAAVALLLEQLFRRRIQALFRLLLFEIVVAAFFLFALGLAVTVSRYVIGGAFALAAVVLFVANLGELRAVQHYRSR